MSFKNYSYKTQKRVVVFVGDIMQHPEQIRAEASRDFSYDGVFDNIQHIFEEADLVVGNFESTFAGLEKLPEDRAGEFVSSDKFAQALRIAGFTHLTMLNNHTFDKGYSGFERTKLIIKNAGMFPIFGHVYDNDVEFLNFTTHMNKDISDLSKYKNYDVLSVPVSLKIALPHWGGQYTKNPINEQRRIAKELNKKDWNVIGSGPHSVHPTDDENDLMIAYSLGDFLSDHQKPGSGNNGKILKVTFSGNKVENYEEFETTTKTTKGLSKIVII